jgi:hypothetical protein
MAGISTSTLRDNMSQFFLAMLLTAALLTNSCATEEQVRAKNAMEASRAAYDRCREQHPADPSKCESLKRVYEADAMAYRELGKGTGPTTTIFMEVGPGK